MNSEQNPKTVLDVKIPEKPAQPEGEQQGGKFEIELGIDGGFVHMKVPVAAGKLAVYGAIQMLHEEAQKFFFAVERAERIEAEKSKSILSRLKIPGVRTR